MNKELTLIGLFEDIKFIKIIQKNISKQFQLAELETTRGGKVGMEVGVTRERIITSMFKTMLGEDKVNTDIKTTEREIDAIIEGVPISIKTKKSQSKTPYFSSVKLMWLTDVKLIKKFYQEFEPKTVMIFAHVNWNYEGGLYYIPVEVQKGVCDEMGKENFLKKPKEGSNQFGIEISPKALRQCVEHSNTLKIPIKWNWDEKLTYNPEGKWIVLWKESLKINYWLRLMEFLRRGNEQTASCRIR